MYISPINIIHGLMQIIETNREQIDALLGYYREGDTLHVYQGLRKTLPLSGYPSLQFQPANASTEWSHTSAQTGEYNIDCYLTLRNDNEQLAAEYTSEVSRMIVKLFNWPDNMAFPIPNEFLPDGRQIYVQFGNVNNITYRSNRDKTLTVTQFTWTGRVLELFKFEAYYGPNIVDWKKDKYQGQDESNS